MVGGVVGDTAIQVYGRAREPVVNVVKVDRLGHQEGMEQYLWVR
ncbi:hypothetical protein [Planotetraspora kaengkrachanensis]|nr:hypothetical protein [Planotetraspora kaengkrachanensis]